MITLPQLSQKEMKTLRQKPAEKGILMQGLALSLYSEQDGFCMALEALSSCKNIDPKRAQEMLEKTITNLKRGRVSTWTMLLRLAKKRPDLPVSQIVLRISPLNKREAAA